MEAAVVRPMRKGPLVDANQVLPLPPVKLPEEVRPLEEMEGMEAVVVVEMEMEMEMEMMIQILMKRLQILSIWDPN